MYESPITIKTEDITRNIMDKQEEYILTQVQMCVDVDKEELIKALKYDREQYEKGWNDRDNEIVRCKDCKYGDPNGHGCKCYHYKLYETHEMSPNDFCSRAERRIDENC